jgi:NAD(P)-dependent dehydrogenase (short-subunit alcohol dehydrogenase family)
MHNKCKRGKRSFVVTQPGSSTQLQGRIAIITGAAKGIGQGIAVEMAREGASIVLADIDEDAMQVTAQSIQQAGGSTLIVATNTSVAEDNQRLINATLAHYGRIDILVNNVGIGIHNQRGLLGTTREDGMRVLQTNLIEPLFLTQRVVQEMVNRQIPGSILFTSSIHASVTYLDPFYATTKAAIAMLVRDLAIDVAGHGIRVNAVAPGAIETRGKADRSYPFIPFGAKGTPTDVANAMVFLASEKASYITGQTLIVDGGLSLVHEAYLDRKGLLKR